MDLYGTIIFCAASDDRLATMIYIFADYINLAYFNLYQLLTFPLVVGV